MITVEINNKPDLKWNERLQKTPTGKPFRCKLGNHSYELMDKNFVKTCKLCGHKFDPNKKTYLESKKGYWEVDEDGGEL